MHKDMEGVLWHGETEHFPRIKHHMQHLIKNKEKNHVFLHMVDHSTIDSLVKDFLNAMAINTANKGLWLQKPTSKTPLIIINLFLELEIIPKF